MTFLQLRELVSSWLDDLNYGYFTEAQVNVWLNNAHKEVQKRLIKAGKNYYLKTVQTTAVVNQCDYAMPSDFKKLHRFEVVINGSIPNESKQPIIPITMNQQDLVPTGSGLPRFYTEKKSRLMLFPAPDSNYKLRLYYTYLVPDMVLDTDTPDVPDSYHELIALLAAEDGFIKDGRVAELLEKKIAAYQADLDSDAADRLLDMPRMIVETGNDSDSGFFW